MRNHGLKKLSVFALAAVMTIGGPSLGVFAEAESTESEENVSTEDDTAKAIELLEDIKGTYEPLFPIITDPQYGQLWLDPCISVVGEEDAPEVAEMLKSACNGTVYGQEAIDAFGDGSEGAQFDCLFINGPSTITFDGSMINGTDENGDQLFSHEYRFVDDLSLAGLMDGYLYETEDEDAGEFKYFYMMPDTPATTYHLEFRYGSDVDALSQYNEGPYAYWLAAGFPVDADEEMVKNVITLFCEENLEEMQTEETSFAGGSGTEEDPWQIANAEQLNLVREDLGAHYILTDDIDLTGAEWEPIGNLSDSEAYSSLFRGIFDGGGHTVTGLEFNSEGPLVGAGLFGVSAGEIRNLNMEGCSVSCTGLVPGDDQAAGIIVGYNMGGTVTGCTVKASDAASLNCTGIIAGGSGGTVTDCVVENCTVTVLGDNEFTDGIKQCDVAECGGLVVGGAFGGTVSDCTASGKIIAEGNEPVGIGGIAGCLEMMSEVKGNIVHVEITAKNGGHAIGGLCGYAGTHSDAVLMMEKTGVEVTEYPSLIHNCEVEAVINANGATHVGGLIGTNLYFFGEETTWNAYDCDVKAEIIGAVTPGALFGRAENCEYSDCSYDVTLDGKTLLNEVGETDAMYESLDQ